jgi:putative ABC transport system permease protein
MTLPTLLKFNLRYYRRHVLLSLLCMLGISLGVGIVVAVELINNSALESFSASVDFLAGRATHSLVSGYGRVDEKLFGKVWGNPLVRAASPIVEVMAPVLEAASEPVRFVGIDPFLDADFRDFSSLGQDWATAKRFLGEDPAPVYVCAELLDRYGLKPGDELTVLVAGMEKKVGILGRLPESARAVLGDNVAVMDISAAQEIFGRIGYLDRIDVIVHGDAKALVQSLPEGIRLTDANEQKSTLSAMLSSFQLNLAAMSLLAIFVGVFLIYNFSMYSVLSRREDLSLLLTLGSDRRALVAAFACESLVLGAVGSVLGLAFGMAVAWASIEKVSGTISDLYFHVNVTGVHLTASAVWRGLGVGLLATFIGTGLPALEVAITPPVIGMKRRSIEDRTQGMRKLLGLLGLGCCVISILTAWASRFSVFWGFFSAFVMTLAFALFAPGFLSPFTHYAGILLRKASAPVETFLAARSIRASLSRTSIAVAALAVALSMTIGVDTMIQSFRVSVATWLDGSLQGDLYISPATTKWAHPLPESLVERLRSDPRVAALERYATYDVRVEGKPVKLRVLEASALERYSKFQFLEGEQGAWQQLQQGKVFISESLGYRLGLKAGKAVVISTPEGDRSFRITAVVRDYSSDQGTVQMDRDVYEKIWQDSRVQSVALFLKPGASAGEVRKDVAREYPGLGRAIVANQNMREDILRIFDKTFSPTATLKGVSLLVALLGVATALTAMLMERSGEMRVLGHLGLTPWELGMMNVYQALFMGLAAFLMSLVCGLVLSYIIIYAINYRSFGWSIDMQINAWVLAKTFIFTTAACLAASVYPTYRLIRTHASAAVKEE